MPPCSDSGGVAARFLEFDGKAQLFRTSNGRAGRESDLVCSVNVSNCTDKTLHITF
jgi:hypothetical protein